MPALPGLRHNERETIEAVAREIARVGGGWKLGAVQRTRNNHLRAEIVRPGETRYTIVTGSNSWRNVKNVVRNVRLTLR